MIASHLKTILEQEICILDQPGVVELFFDREHAYLCGKSNIDQCGAASDLISHQTSAAAQFSSDCIFAVFAPLSVVFRASKSLVRRMQFRQILADCFIQHTSLTIVDMSSWQPVEVTGRNFLKLLRP